MAKRSTSTMQMILSVVVICAVAAAGLALTYAVTKDRISAQDREAQLKALKLAYPGVDEFDSVSSDALTLAQRAAGEVPVYGVYKALEGGQQVGWAVIVGPRGYGGPIRMVVGLDRDGKVTGISIVAMNETPGLGTQIVEKESFLEQFIGMESETAAEALKDVDMITGATKSSRGARHGVEAATLVYNEVLESQGGATQ